MMGWLKIDWSSFARTLPWYPPRRWSIHDPNPLWEASVLDIAEARYRLGDRL